MADAVYIVRSTAILGPPTTDRTFLQGEMVTETDFIRKPGVFETLLRRGSIRVVSDADAEAAWQKRLDNARNEFALPVDATEQDIETVLASRRAGFAEAQMRTRRILEARQAVAPVLPGAPPVEPIYDVLPGAPVISTTEHVRPWTPRNAEASAPKAPASEAAAEAETEAQEDVRPHVSISPPGVKDAVPELGPETRTRGPRGTVR